MLFAIFLTIVITALTGLHYYVWARLVRDTGLPGRTRRIITAVIVLMALSVPLSLMLRRLVDLQASRPLFFVVFGWLGLIVVTFFCLLGADLVRLGVWIGSRLLGERRAPEAPAASEAPAAREPAEREAEEARIDLARRRLLARALGGAALLGAVGASAIGARRALGLPEVKRVTVPLERLPAAREGFVLVQLTDLHLGPTLGGRWLEGVVEKTLALGPDLIAITGDLVDGSVAQLRREIVAPLARLKAPHGVFFVTGNHEYYAGAEPWIAELRRIGIRVLQNERVSIGGPESSADSFDLAGVNDPTARRMKQPGPDLAAAVTGRDPKRELVLLSHQPKLVDEAARHGVGLQLSGHTHGGQIWPWHYAVLLQQPYLKGLARHDGRTWIYVSEGTGYWGPPIRLGSRCEISALRLTRGD